MKRAATTRGPGRPPAGPKGEKVSSYPQLTIRLPPETKAKLNTLSLLTGTPIWRVIDRAIDAYVQHLPDEERLLLGSLAERIVRGDWPVVSHWQAALHTPYARTAIATAKKSRKTARSRDDSSDRSK
jgi:predicted DNA-binding protein